MIEVFKKAHYAFRNMKDENKSEFQQALEIIIAYAYQCPKCHSDDIIETNDKTGQMSCQRCSNKFVESDYMKKTDIVSLLQNNNLSEAADAIQEMAEDEFEDFLVNQIYE